MRSHMRRSENERSNQTVTKTVTQVIEFYLDGYSAR